ncbi:MAG: MFS transporter [Chloroflexota bacterium]|nr:MFS transporter [Chloroflexota bacterium]
MYTLEDDQETSSRFKKKAGTFGDPSAQEEVADQTTTIQQPGATGSHHFAPRQLSGSFKRLTTPGKANAGNQRVALAALTIACIGVFFTALDQTVVVTALPQIINDLQIPITQLDRASWIVSAYLLGFVVVMPLMGRVSDLYGRRRIFLICLSIFGVGSLLCGLAPILGKPLDLSFLGVFGIDTSSPGLILLIAARLIQAIGGGSVVPVAMAIASDFYGQERRGLALGIIGAVTEAGGAIGPVYGALVVQRLGWQFIFYLNIPIVVGLLVAAWILVPKGKHLGEKIDWIGAILLGLALTTLSLGLAQQGTSLGPVSTSGAAPQNNPLALALAAVFLLAFILVERKVRWPVVDLSMFRRIPFSASSLVSLFVGAALIIAMADIPIFIDTVVRSSILDSGLALIRLTAMIPVGALLGGWLGSRITYRATGVIGLLFTAVGFFLMSRWPIQVTWSQITISTMTAGLGFGLVIAPISTTAINAVRARQAGMSSSVVTALRMVGMTLGLAALTSWALAYFKQLAATYPSLPTTATADQFTQWSKGYANHLIAAAHTVYTSVFFTSMILCLIAIIPAIFLWGSKAPLEEVEPSINDAVTMVMADIAVVPTAPMPKITTVLSEGVVPTRVRWWKDRKRRRRGIIYASIALVVLLGGAFIATFFLPEDDTPAPNNNGPTVNPVGDGATPISGPRMIQLALDRGALTSVFTSQLHLQSGVLTDLNVAPAPNDGLVLSLSLHIDSNGIHRVMPIEMDGVIGIDKQQNLQLQVQRLLRDGNDAGPAAAASMQSAMNEMIASSVMPALRGQLKGVKLVSVHTSTAIGCGKGTEMLVLLIQAPPIQGIAAQPTPASFCFTGPIDLNKLLPH